MTKKIPYSQFKHGQRCTCEIQGKEVTDAKISINGNGSIYICQNIKDGLEADDMLGYKYGWLAVDHGYYFEERDKDIRSLTLLPRTIEDVEEGDEIVSKDVGERKVLGRCGQIVFLGRLLSNDAYENTYSIHDLKFRGYTIKQDTPTEEEIGTETTWEVDEGKAQRLITRDPEGNVTQVISSDGKNVCINCFNSLQNGHICGNIRKEITKEEIASKFNIPLDQLRIKE